SPFYITTHLPTLSLHDALPISISPPSRVISKAICPCLGLSRAVLSSVASIPWSTALRNICSSGAIMRSSKDRSSSLSALLTSRRSEEHTSELQSRFDLVCRLLL